LQFRRRPPLSASISSAVSGASATAIEGKSTASAAKGSRLLTRLSRTLRNPSVWKFARRAREAFALSHNVLATGWGSAEPEEIEALSGVVVGTATLGSDLMRARMFLQGKSNAIPI
jgi:hypothetical protein